MGVIWEPGRWLGRRMPRTRNPVLDTSGLAVLSDYFAALGVTIGAGGVSAIEDQGSKSADLAQGTEATRPSYEETGLLGRPALRFVSANNDSLLCASYPAEGSGSFTVYAAIDQLTASGITQFLWDFQTGRLLGEIGVFGATASVGFFDGTHHAIAAITTGAQVLAWVLTSGGNGELFRGRTSLGVAAYTAKALGGQFGLGGAYNGGTGFGSNVRLGRLLICSGAHDATQRAQVWDWANAYYPGICP